MKKLMLSLIAVAMTAGLVEAQTNVLSKNAVGYVKVTAPSNGLFMASLPFFSIDAVDYTIPSVIGNQLVGGGSFLSSDNIIKWVASQQNYAIFWKTAGGQWRQFPEAVETTNTLSPGEGFWIRNRRTTNQVLFLMGEVPDSETLPASSLPVVQGLQMMSYAYPAETQINSLSIITNAQRGGSFLSSDNILYWDPAVQNYAIYWLPSGTNTWRKFPEVVPTSDYIKPGEGVFYRRRGASSFSWNEMKPYTWP